MRRLVPVLLTLALVVAPGCKRSKKARVEVVEEDANQLLSVVNTGDPRGAIQLVKGFYEIETDGWRWTKGAFAVTLRTPLDAASRGARLEFKFALPEAVVKRTGPVTLTARVGGVDLEPETFVQPGEHVYSRDLPASVTQGEAVTVDFRLSKFLAAGEVEQRELGVIATSFGLMAK
jgi:hypothetical protein